MCAKGSKAGRELWLNSLAIWRPSLHPVLTSSMNMSLAWPWVSLTVVRAASTLSVCHSLWQHRTEQAKGEKVFPQVLDVEEVGLQLRQGLGQDVDLGADHEGALQLHFRQRVLPAFSISWLTVSLGAMVR